MKLQHPFVISFGLTFVLGAQAFSCGSEAQIATNNNQSTGGSAGTGGDSWSAGIGGSGGGLNIGLAGNSGIITGAGGGGTTTGVVFSIKTGGANNTLKIVSGMPVPTLQLSAVGNNGASVPVTWSVDRGEIGRIDPKTGVFTPSGNIAGVVTITGTAGNHSQQAMVSVAIQSTQNGATAAEMNPKLGPGGIGGVGGEGVGVVVSDTIKQMLQSVPTADPTLTWLYPYDKTVWPRGLLAPLLQWGWGAGKSTDGVAIHIESKTGLFTYDGFFGRPALLAAGAPFARHPIPQDIWQQATGVEQLDPSAVDTLTLRVVVTTGGKAYGPITRTWSVAPARLAGTVYYNSYGTHLVTNSDGKDQNGKYYGAAVLGIKAGQSDPYVVAGTDSPADKLGTGEGCRACHTVAARGSRLIVQQGPPTSYGITSVYELTQTNNTKTIKEDVIASDQYKDIFSWAALSPDGGLAFTNSAFIAEYDSKTRISGLYSLLPQGGAKPNTGLPADLKAATPTFSPDGQHVAFTLQAGTLGTVQSQDRQVVALDFNPAMSLFSNPRAVFTIPVGQNNCVGFPSFLPTNDALVVQYQLNPCFSGNFGPYIGTSGVSGELWWSDLKMGKQTRLNALNGKNPDGTTSYLPTGPNNHNNDSVLNYEPTVSPVVSGGYAWVIFTSRRLYGSVATIDPNASDPRKYDYTQETTTKKLWIAAVDLNAPPGTDPSHPAFYLPAQELRAGNARGFWVQDPCVPDNQTCETGDQCCGGYCQRNASGALACGHTTPMSCAGIQEKCDSAASCCDPNARCINNFCARTNPPLRLDRDPTRTA